MSSLGILAKEGLGSGAAGVLLPFLFFAGIGVGRVASSRLTGRPPGNEDGGVMADTEEMEKGSESGNSAVQGAEGGSEPEKAPTRSIRKRGVDGRAVLHEVSEEALFAIFEKVIGTIVTNVKEKDCLASAKFLVELVRLLRVKAEVTEETYESVAAVIWESYRKVQATEVEGTGVVEPGSEGGTRPLVVNV